MVTVRYVFNTGSCIASSRLIRRYIISRPFLVAVSALYGMLLFAWTIKLLINRFSVDLRSAPSLMLTLMLGVVIFRLLLQHYFRNIRDRGRELVYAISEFGFHNESGETQMEFDWSCVEELAIGRHGLLMVLRSKDMPEREFHYLPDDAYTAGSKQDAVKLAQGKVSIRRAFF